MMTTRRFWTVAFAIALGVSPSVLQAQQPAGPPPEPELVAEREVFAYPSFARSNPFVPLIDVDYDALVVEPEATLRRVFARLGLEFGPVCLDFHRNPAPTNTASAVQVREPLHARSVGRWRHFARQLEPLVRMLRDAGIDTKH
jgi:hypothetical protein